jgi:hypothetical protein
MNRNMYETASTKENPMRITRLVSVILNGVVFSKLATSNGNDVNAMADSLMVSLPNTVQHSIRSHELTQVQHSLRAEIHQRMNATLSE